MQRQLLAEHLLLKLYLYKGIQKVIPSQWCPADGLYEFSGSSQPDVSFELKANSVRTASRGTRSITFHDGGEIGVEYPIYYLRGEAHMKAVTEEAREPQAGWLFPVTPVRRRGCA